MEINGRSDDSVDTIVWEPDYFELGAIERFVSRMEATDVAEQFLFRESEFDCAFRQVDMLIADLQASGSTDGPDLVFAMKLRNEVWEGHEYVGAHNTERAAMALRRMALMLKERGA